MAIISEDIAQRYWSGADPIGKAFSWGPVRQTVVGVGGSVRALSLETDAQPLFYLPLATTPTWVNPMTLVLRSTASPTDQVPAVRGVLRSLDPGVPMYDVSTVEEILDNSVGSRRFTTLLGAAFAALALLLTCVGLFGVMASVVSERFHDIGV